MHCTHCGSEELEEGVIAEEPHGRAGWQLDKWYSGPPTVTKWMRTLTDAWQRRSGTATVYRCQRCGHLDAFVREVTEPSG